MGRGTAGTTGKRFVFYFAAAIVCLGMSGCFRRHNLRVDGYDCRSLEKSRIYDFRRPENVRVEEFLRYDTGKQYAAFICGCEFTYNWASEIEYAFARKGGKVIDIVKARLGEARDDLRIYNLVSLLSLMQMFKSYDVAGDDELMRLAEVRVQGIRGPGWKEDAESSLRDIRHRREARGLPK